MFKHILTIIFVLAFLLAVWLVLSSDFVSGLFGNGDEQPTDQTPGTSLPTPPPTEDIDDTSPSPSVPPPAGEKIIEQADGTTIVAADFIDNGRTFEDPANPDHYILSGDLGYCLPSGECPNNEVSDAFMISFGEQDDYFSTILLTTPLAAARSEAEDFLQETLNITEEQLCSLNYSLAAPYWVSREYAGVELGFSFCPNSVQL